MHMRRKVPVHRYPTNVTQVHTDSTAIVQAMRQFSFETEAVTHHVRDGDNVVQIEYGDNTVFVDLEEIISYWIKHSKPFR